MITTRCTYCEAAEEGNRVLAGICNPHVCLPEDVEAYELGKVLV